MFEFMTRTLPEIEVAVRKDILDKYPNEKIVFTNDSDEDGKIVYVDIVEPNVNESVVAEDVIGILDNYRGELSQLDKTYIMRFVN